MTSHGAARRRDVRAPSHGDRLPLPQCMQRPAKLPAARDAPAGGNTRFAALFDAITANIAQVVQGKQQPIELAVMCLLAEGHLLIEDVPGVGKTSLAKALATSIDCTWKRVQFTPDLLPGRPRRRQRLPAQRPSSSASSPARCSPTSCSPTRSTGPRRRPSRRCSRRWRSARSPSTARATPLDAAVHGDRHPEPGRPGGHVPPPREPARPLPAAHRRSATPSRDGRDLDPRRPRARSSRCPSCRRSCRPPRCMSMIDAVRSVYVADRAEGLPRRPRRCQPPPPGRRARPVAAGHAAARRRGPRPRRRPRPQLRHPRRRQVGGRRRPQPPPDAARRPRRPPRSRRRRRRDPRRRRRARRRR